MELQKSMDARKMFGSSEANGNTGACGVRSVNGPANVAPNARPMCLWPAETEQFAQPVESATAVGKMRASHARGRIVKHAHAINTLPFSNGQKLGFVIQGVCLRRDVALRCTVGESHQRGAHHASAPPSTCSPQSSCPLIDTACHGPRGLVAWRRPVQCGLSQLRPAAEAPVERAPGE